MSCGWVTAHDRTLSIPTDTELKFAIQFHDWLPVGPRFRQNQALTAYESNRSACPIPDISKKISDSLCRLEIADCYIPGRSLHQKYFETWVQLVLWIIFNIFSFIWDSLQIRAALVNKIHLKQYTKRRSLLKFAVSLNVISSTMGFTFSLASAINTERNFAHYKHWLVCLLVLDSLCSNSVFN